MIAASSGNHPAPTPSINRPPEYMSSVAAAFAVSIGLRSGNRQTLVPMRMREVACAAIASATNGSAR